MMVSVVVEAARGKQMNYRAKECCVKPLSWIWGAFEVVQRSCRGLFKQPSAETKKLDSDSETRKAYQTKAID